jgi:hypothetical protein
MCSFIVNIVSAVGLRNADGMFGKSDPYVTMTSAGVTFRTRTIDNDLNPNFNETFIVSLSPGAGMDERNLGFEVVDSNDDKHEGVAYNSKDDPLGSSSKCLPSADAPESQPGADWTNVKLRLTGAGSAKEAFVNYRFKPFAEETARRDCVLVHVVGAKGLRNADLTGGSVGSQAP